MAAYRRSNSARPSRSPAWRGSGAWRAGDSVCAGAGASSPGFMAAAPFQGYPTAPHPRSHPSSTSSAPVRDFLLPRAIEWPARRPGRSPWAPRGGGCAMRNLKAPVLVVLTALLFHVRADGLTVEVASGGGELVRAPDTWRFFRGKTDPSAPITAWKGPDCADTGWESGPGGFGYKYTAGIGTTLSDMRNGYLTVFVRRTFDLAGPLPAGDLELVVDYDDGFAAYLNGGLVAWRSLSLDPATAGFDRTAPGISHTAGAPETIVLGKAADLLQEGKNVLAIECHNNTLDSRDQIG